MKWMDVNSQLPKLEGLAKKKFSPGIQVLVWVHETTMDGTDDSYVDFVWFGNWGRDDPWFHQFCHEQLRSEEVPGVTHWSYPPDGP